MPKSDQTPAPQPDVRGPQDPLDAQYHRIGIPALAAAARYAPRPAKPAEDAARDTSTDRILLLG